ncbi:MAG: polysaccharide biosynthesis tyrosine autokinase [Fibrobacter sp.]|nr:polysaccharide biosynthesis tyrosine autokinase [Fibrobacter sp.]
MLPLNENGNQGSAPQVQAPASSLSVFDVIRVLWNGKWVMILFALIGAAVGFYKANWEIPMFTSDALIQINTKGGQPTAAIGATTGLLEVQSPANAEMMLMKSRMVLEKVVEEQHLRFHANPMGDKDRILHREGRLDIEYLKLPRGSFRARALGKDSFAVVSHGKEIVRGAVGETYREDVNGDTLVIRVGLLKAKAGQEFSLSVSSELAAISSLANGLSVSEAGKNSGSGMIKIIFSHRYADRAAAILNSVVNTYQRQNVELRGAEAEKTLEFLDEQLPGVKAKLDSIEAVLAKYRREMGTVDISGETSSSLGRSVDLQKQLADLDQQKAEALRVYTPEHPNIQAIELKRKALLGELGKVKSVMKKLPEKQQELLRLQGEVELNNKLYTTMLNNAQQLRVVRAGELGNVRIVDHARIAERTSYPNKRSIEMMYLGICLGIGAAILILFRIFSRKGIRNSSEVENATGVSVYAKVPESRNKLLRMRKHSAKNFLVVDDPDDRASEAFRSLLTAVDFSMEKNQILMVSGLIPGVGKSFVAENVAALAAQMGRKVLLIDGDMRRGRVKSKSKEGLANVLMRNCPVADAITQSPVDNLYVMGGGHTQLYPSELLRGDNFKNLLEELRSQYDLIIVDTPPISLVTDATLIYPLVDFSLIVLHYGKHSVPEVVETLGALDRIKDGPKAFVLNHCERGHHGYGYGYYGYYSYGYYKKKKK